MQTYSKCYLPLAGLLSSSIATFLASIATVLALMAESVAIVEIITGQFHRFSVKLIHLWHQSPLFTLSRGGNPLIGFSWRHRPRRTG